MQRIVELALVLLACLTPVFLFADRIDGDEFIKGGAGAGLAGIVIAVGTVYTTWKNKP